jgi:hypothetical protein
MLTSNLRAALVKATDIPDQSAGTTAKPPAATGNEAGTAAQPAVPVTTQTGQPAVQTPPANTTEAQPRPVEELKAKLTASLLAAKTAS